MFRIFFSLLIVTAVSFPVFAVLPGQEGEYKGKAKVRYSDLGTLKSRSWKTEAVLQIEPNGSATFTGDDINSELQVEAGLYHGSGTFFKNQQVGNMPLHFTGNGKLKGTFHYAYPGTSEMMEGKFSLKKQAP